MFVLRDLLYSSSAYTIYRILLLKVGGANQTGGWVQSSMYAYISTMSTILQIYRLDVIYLAVWLVMTMLRCGYITGEVCMKRQRKLTARQRHAQARRELQGIHPDWMRYIVY